MQSFEITGSGLWQRTRGMRYVFLAGVIVGMVLGWFFHGLISTFMQIGMVAILLVPLAIVLYMWWRSSRERQRSQTMSVMRWEAERFEPYREEPVDRLRRDDVIDVRDAREVREPEWQR